MKLHKIFLWFTLDRKGFHPNKLLYLESVILSWLAATRSLPQILHLQMLSTVLNIIIFEDCRNQWSMSRPLLGLILLNEKVSEPVPDAQSQKRGGCAFCRGHCEKHTNTPRWWGKWPVFLSTPYSCFEQLVIAYPLEVSTWGRSGKGKA